MTIAAGKIRHTEIIQTMKTTLWMAKWWVVIFLLAAAGAGGQTTNLTALLQQGLVEEQANQNLDAAIADYQALATQFDKDRQVAATAIFRIGECYRMEGRTNEAAAQYERILHDFSDQKSLATLSQEDLKGMGMETKPVFAERLANVIARAPAQSPETQTRIIELEREIGDMKEQLGGINGARPEQRNVIVQQNFSNPVLTTLMQQLAESQQRLAALNQVYSTNNFEVMKETATRDTINSQINDQMNGIVMGLQSKINADEHALAELRQQSLPIPTPDSTPPQDGEDKEIQRIQQVIQTSPDLINQPGQDGNTELTKAAGAGELKVVAYLLDHGADVNQNTGKFFPLLQAVVAGNRSMVELLLNRGADVNARSGDGDALHMAVRKRFQSVVEVLLAHKADVNNLDASKETPLDVAAATGQKKIVQMLLAAGADPNLADDNGRTALNRAIAGDAPDVVGVLLAAGAEVNTEDESRRTPLSYAAEFNNQEVIKLLLDAKADLNGSKVNPPLLLATKYVNTNSMELLLRAGADPNRVGGLEQMGADRSELETEYLNHRNHMTPLWLAIYKGSLPAVELLLQFKADPNDTQTTGRSLLFYVLGQPAILEAMLDDGAKTEVTSPDEVEWTPLGAAVSGNNARAVEILLKHGANPNFHNRNGVTPLHRAVYDLVDGKIFELLLAGGANPNVRTGNGRTPLDELNARTDQNSTPEQHARAIILADLLRRHGARDRLPDWDRITISRPDANFSRPIFFKSTNDWNHYTLLEAIYDFYAGQQSVSMPGPGYGYNRFIPPQEALPFPDLTCLVIARPHRDLANDAHIKVNLLNDTNGIDFTKDVPLEFGDVVEIPESDHPLGERAAGLPQLQADLISHHLAGKLKIIAGGKTTKLPLYSIPSASTLNAVIQSNAAQSVLLSSSDLSRVKVKRQDLKTGREQEWTVDCRVSQDASNMFPVPQLMLNLDTANHPMFSTDLLLRDGDVIEVPEKDQP
jgi:ankyrin repeat protein